LNRFAAALVFLIASTAAFAQEAPPIKPSSDAQRSDIGLAWVVLTPPAGAVFPTNDDYVTLDYTIWGEDGGIVDSTAKHPNLRTFAVSKIFPGLQQSVRVMKAGEKRRVWIPADLSSTRQPIVMEVELREIKSLSAPADVAAPPADAEKSKSGLAWKVLQAGSGDQHPKGSSEVAVIYSGWTTDGNLFDTSLAHGETMWLPLPQLIAGWREGIQMMTPGEKRRFWIPEKLAYQGKKGMPAGMLVFDIELVKFK
jgi:peptidylprolyl isomerase